MKSSRLAAWIVAAAASAAGAQQPDVPSHCRNDPNPPVAWNDTRNIRAEVWTSLARYGFEERWASMCPSERLMAAFNTHIKGRMPDMRTKRGCQSDVYRKQLERLEAYFKGLGLPEADAQRRYQDYKADFDNLCGAYERRVQQNRAAGWGYGWLFDFRPDKAADWTATGPVPSANDGARAQGVCTEWADDISKALAGPWRYWTVASYDRKNGAAHTAVAACPKTKAEAEGRAGADAGVLCEMGHGFILDPWADGKPDLYTPAEFNDVSNALETYSEIMNPGLAVETYKNWFKSKLN